MTTVPQGVNSKPSQPGDVPSTPTDRMKFVQRDNVLNELKKMPDTTDGLLLVSPIGSGNPDDYANLAMHVNPDMAFKGSMSFLINTRPDANHYDVLDLNNLPPGVEVQLVIRATDGSWQQNNLFRGTEGNIQGGS